MKTGPSPYIFTSLPKPTPSETVVFDVTFTPGPRMYRSLPQDFARRRTAIEYSADSSFALRPLRHFFGFQKKN